MRADAPTRRAVLTGLAATAVATPSRAQQRPTEAEALRIPPGDRVEFHILRSGSRVGQHVVSFTRSGARLQVASRVEIVIRLGPIPVFRYTHSVDEDWRIAADGTGMLVAANAHTNDDGTKHFMRAEATPRGLAVQSDEGGSYTAPAGTLIATHWNIAELDGPMVNPQGGKLLMPDVVRGPRAPVPLAGGGSVEAHRYALSGDVTLDLWYDLASQWAATRFVAQDSSVVLYRRV
jgi:hypothetical protein